MTTSYLDVLHAQRVVDVVCVHASSLAVPSELLRILKTFRESELQVRYEIKLVQSLTHLRNSFQAVRQVFRQLCRSGI